MRFLQRTIFQAIALIVLITITLLFAGWFVSLERVFYFWDFGGYQQSTINQVDASFTSKLIPLRVAFSSMKDDYNLLYTLPLIPVLRLLGNYHARGAYIVSLTLVYFLPYLFTVGLIARRLVLERRTIIFWGGILATLTFPVAWLPVLRGYPDSGGAFFIMLALWAYLYDIELKKWPQMLLIGFCLAAASLFRRHFAYASVAFMVAIGLMALYRAMAMGKRSPRVALQSLMRSGVRIGLIVLISLASLWLVARPFLNLVATTNYYALYSSWQTPPLQVLGAFQRYYGWIAIALAGVGFVGAILSGVLRRTETIFVGLFGLISVLQWALIVRQSNPHYTLHFTFVILLGWVALLGWMWAKWKPVYRLLGFTALGCYLIANTVAWLLPEQMPQSLAVRSLFTYETEPNRRPDYDEVVRMIDRLHAIAGSAPIYVVDSSGIITYDMVFSADAALSNGGRLNILRSPQVDSRDYYPIEPLLAAEYVIVSDPLQIHLTETEQGVVSTVYEAFAEQWEIAQDFVRLPEIFHLMWGVETSVYQRVKSTDLTVAIRTIYLIQKEVGQRPGTQPDWVRMDNFSSALSGKPGASYTLQVNLLPDAGQNTASLLYLGEMDTRVIISGAGSVQGEECAGVKIKIMLAQANGTFSLVAEDLIQSSSIESFSWNVATLDAPYLLMTLSVNGKANTSCQIAISDLFVSMP